MKRLVCVVTLALCLICMVSCSKEQLTVVIVDGASIKVNDEIVVLNEWTESGAAYADAEHSASYLICTTLEECKHLPAKFFPEDLADYNGCLYYRDNLDTQVRMYNDEVSPLIEGFSLSIKESAVDYKGRMEELYKIVTTVPFGKSFELYYAGIVKVDVDGISYRIRPEEIVIPGILRVSKDDRTLTATTYETIGDVVVEKASTAKFDYYMYQGVRVQATVGTDISLYLTFIK